MPRFLGQKKLRIDDENADESDDTLTMFNSVTAQEVNLILLIILKISNLEKNLFFLVVFQARRIGTISLGKITRVPIKASKSVIGTHLVNAFASISRSSIRSTSQTHV